MEEIKRLFTAKGEQRRLSEQAYKFCFCCRRMFQLKLAEPPQEIVDLFDKYSKNGAMTVENLRSFLAVVQEESCTVENAQNIFNSLKHLNIFQRSSLNLHAFFSYLCGNSNPPLASLGVHHDMEKPLSHYFLYTGHNSYLTGNQLSSTSSIDPIVKALKDGVKVIELDLWPNSKHSDIIVTHGGTMTSSVKFIRCLEAIREFAFYASDYPVILTFEDHLSPSLQAKMVKNTLGDKLCLEMNRSRFPSPEELKGKILVSTKPPKEDLDSFKEQEQHHGQKNEDIESRDYEEFEIQIKDNTEEEDDEDTATPKYKQLIAIHAMKLKKGMKIKTLLKDDSGSVARLSINEEKLKDVAKKHAADLVRFTQKNLLRVYPKGSRIMSSNYNPLIAWTHGAQMVAFNMQGYGKHLWVMQGMFRANGGCGYVKKPEFMLGDEDFNPNIEGPVKKILKIKLFMGYGWHLDFQRTHFDPFSPPDFFTKVEILGVPADIKKETTLTIENQWVPMWNHEFEFRLTVPELALLRIEVCEHDVDRRHGFGGQTCLPVSELRSGIRAVPLYSKKGVEYDNVKLLVRFQFSAEVTQCSRFPAM